MSTRLPWISSHLTVLELQKRYENDGLGLLSLLRQLTFKIVLKEMEENGYLPEMAETSLLWGVTTHNKH